MVRPANPMLMRSRNEKTNSRKRNHSRCFETLLMTCCLNCGADALAAFSAASPALYWEVAILESIRFSSIVGLLSCTSVLDAFASIRSQTGKTKERRRGGVCRAARKALSLFWGQDRGSL